MSKPKLLIAETGLAQPWFMPQWTQSFDCEIYQPGQHYHDMIALVDDRYEKKIYDQLKQMNLRIVRPYLMDTFVHDSSQMVSGELVLRAQESVWIMESLQFAHLGYNTRRPHTRPDKFFLLLINRLRDHRQKLLQAVDQYLPDSLYTCVNQGIMLPDDVYEPGRDPATTANDRYYVPWWYGQTAFSLVAETMVDTQLFVSEKSFKPLAHGHPFLIFGTAGTLAYLRSLGFETFGHRVDESYDKIINPDKKSEMILATLEDLHKEFTTTGGVFQDVHSQGILAHNQALFFDADKIGQLFRQQIVQPIMEFAESP